LGLRRPDHHLRTLVDLSIVERADLQHDDSGERRCLANQSSKRVFRARSPSGHMGASAGLPEDPMAKPILNLDEVVFDDVEENGLYTSSRGAVGARIGAHHLG
jgi:hypothetical protein